MTSILFLSQSSIWYRHKTEDPWFSATTKLSDNRIDSGFFLADESSGVMGCATSRDLCRPDLPASTGCVNMFAKDVKDRMAELWPDLNDQAVLRVWLSGFNDDGDIEIFFEAPTSPSLLARQTLFEGIQQVALASNAWKTELEYTFQVTLAMMQSQVVEVARGFWIGKCRGGTECQRICHSQVCSLTSSVMFQTNHFVSEIQNLLVLLL